MSQCWTICGEEDEPPDELELPEELEPPLEELDVPEELVLPPEELEVPVKLGSLVESSPQAESVNTTSAAAASRTNAARETTGNMIDTPILRIHVLRDAEPGGSRGRRHHAISVAVPATPLSDETRQTGGFASALHSAFARYD